MRKWYPIVMIVVAYAAGAIAFSRLPERVPTHFDGHGVPNGWSHPVVGAFLLPTIMLLVWPIMRFLPRIDPRKANYEKFQPTYDALINLVLTMLLGLHVMLLASALGAPVRIERTTPILVGVMVVIMGNMLPRARSNFWFGIRTPWTLSSDRVWERTHRVGGYLLMAAGFVAIAAGVFTPFISGIVMGAAIGTAALTSVAYSYVAWRQENQIAPEP